MPTIKDDIRTAETLRRLATRLGAEADMAKALADEAWYDLRLRIEDEVGEGVRAGGYNYVPYVQTHAVVQDKEAFVAWAREHAPELITGTPRKQLLNERVNAALDSGQPLPPGLGYFPEPKLSRRKT